MVKPDKYVGIDKDVNGGMTTIGKLIRDAWVFGILPEDETCEGWNYGRINALLDQVSKKWDEYGCLASHLPEDLFERHQKIYGAAVLKAKEAGWSGELETDDDK